MIQTLENRNSRLIRPRTTVSLCAWLAMRKYRQTVMGPVPAGSSRRF